MTLDELSDWAAAELYEVTERSNSIQLELDPKRTVVSGLEISNNTTKKELLKKIIENPDADRKNSGIDEKIIEQIRMAKRDNSDLSREFMNAINMFVADFNTDVFNYVYKHIQEIKNRLIRTVFIRKLVSAPGEVVPKEFSNANSAKLCLDLLYEYPYTDHNLIGGNHGMISLYDVSHNYDMRQVYAMFYQFMWNRILAEASKEKPDAVKIENLCNVAVVKLMGINRSRALAEQDTSISEYSLRDIFNTKYVLNYVKEHADEIKQKQHQDYFNQIRMNEAQALLYKQATDKKRKKRANHDAVLTQGNGKNM